MTPTFLIPRDLPLEPGRKLLFKFTVAFEVTLDEDVLADEQTITVHQLEQWLGGDNIDEDVLYRSFLGGHERNVIEHTVALDDRYEGADDGDVRFETTWEHKERERGQQGTWASRVWIDGVPSAGALPLGPESNPPVLAPTEDAPEMCEHGLYLWMCKRCKDSDHPTAEEVMTRDG